MDKNTFYPIYEGTRPYQNNIAILKDYNGQRQKLTYCYKAVSYTHLPSRISYR